MPLPSLPLKKNGLMMQVELYSSSKILDSQITGGILLAFKIAKKYSNEHLLVFGANKDNQTLPLNIWGIPYQKNKKWYHE